MNQYILEIDFLKDENARLRSRVDELENITQSLSVPIIPSILPDTLLVPIMGSVLLDRFEMVAPYILTTAYESNADSVILDFTAVVTNISKEFNILASHIEQLTESLKIMGIQVLLVGFSPQFTQELVKSGVTFIQEIEAFSTFKAALQFLMKKKGIAFTTIN